MERAAPTQTPGQQAVHRAEAAMAAADHPLLKVAHRSTTDQREAFLEQLYGDYAELQRQRDEIGGRKRQMDFDAYDSNQKGIHDVLFASTDAADGALGDWDTWERVDTVVKRYAYGRPRHAAPDKKEMSAMQSRLDAVHQALQERGAMVQSLAQNFETVQQELAGVLKLLRMKDNEIRTLSNQNSTATLQLRCVQRECAALRGLRSEGETSAVKEDLRFLIEANKTLEQENRQLRRRLNACEGAMATTPRASCKDAAPDVASRSRSPDADEAGASTASRPFDADLDRCVDDDAYRRALLHQNIPLSGAVVDAKREAEQWKRRLEAEVHSALETLDRDAMVVEQSVQVPAGRTGAPGPARMENGVFVSYATYQTAVEAQPWRKSVQVVAAPPLPTATAAAVPAAPLRATATADATVLTGTSSATKTAATGIVTSAAPSARTNLSPTPPLPQTASPEPDQPAPPPHPKEERKLRTSLHGTRRKKSAVTAATSAAMAAAAGAVSTKKAGGGGGGRRLSSAAQRGRRTTALSSNASSSTSVSGGAAALAQLKSAVLQCAELSRASALRRELLHVQWLRQQLHGERERVASLVAAQAEATKQEAAAAAAATAAQGPPRRPGPGHMTAESSGAVFVPPSLPMATKARQSAGSPRRVSASLVSVSDRLRHAVHESRPLTRDPDEGGGEVEGRPGNSGVRATSEDSRPSVSPAQDPLCSPSWAQATQTYAVLSPALSPSVPRARVETPPPSTRRPSSAASLTGTPADVAASASATALSRVGDAEPVHPPPVPAVTAVGRGDVRVGRLASEAAWLRLEMRRLRGDAVAFGDGVQEALRLLGTLFAQQQQRVQQTRDEERLVAMRVTAQTAMEEAAVARAVHLLEDRFGARLSHDLSAAGPLPDSATDEEWFANELRLAALEMVRETVQTHTAPADATAAPPPPGHRAAPSRESADDAAALARAFFEEDVLPNSLPWSKGLFGTAKRWGAPTDMGDAVDEDDVGTGKLLRGHGVPDRRQPLPHPSSRPLQPTQWYWKAPDPYGGRQPGASRPDTLPAPKERTGGLGTASLLVPNPPTWRLSPADVASIRPTVMRYDFSAAAQQAQQGVNEHVRRATAYIYGSQFDDFVREFIVPIISAATHVTAGTGMDVAMRTAVHQLRERARQRCKRGVRLLFNRVANNVRTRSLLRRTVHHGEGFVSYVGVLYNKWRKRLEEERRQMRAQQQGQRASLLSLLHLHMPAAAAPAAPAPPPSSAAHVSDSNRRPPRRPLQGSSYHFNDAKFDANKRTM
ncbi:hypothetical protein NESM_000099800 [Novymonas esmeraldas]|uniref:Uncharacterized protein n=1 Tax=Novymonas esmeraldas TaxID=1808958 RepID=A0AAW0F222_9TRYP